MSKTRERLHERKLAVVKKFLLQKLVIIISFTCKEEAQPNDPKTPNYMPAEEVRPRVTGRQGSPYLSRKTQSGQPPPLELVLLAAASAGRGAWSVRKAWSRSAKREERATSTSILTLERHENASHDGGISFL
ncbi:hypothetical protein H6P81_005016 [Aristolochia fimbriata]|uniref:Uncharacterized protein n=1 Tax=Aristolochia fimbriata TaxID=158543 RepID=A0AAV7EWU5_ARIFI|nr:hypothetical protein H6P81_005016 [Aristolochia fimbriata]